MTQWRCLFLLLLSLCTLSVQAYEPAAIKHNGLEIVPSVNINEEYNTNLRAQAEAEASWITSVMPRVAIRALGKTSVYELSYQLNLQYISATATTLTSHNVQANAEVEFNDRNRVALEAGISAFQSPQNPYAQNQDLAFTEKRVSADYVYGAKTAKGNLGLGYEYLDYRSDNGLNQEQERTVHAANANFKYRLTPKTHLMSEVKVADYQYTTNTAQNNQEAEVILGASWEHTANLTRYAKLGRVYKQFEQAGKGRASINTWEVSSDWTPIEHTLVHFSTYHRLDEGSYGADYVKDKAIIANWQHDWSERLSTILGGSVQERDFAHQRKDDIQAVSMRVNYDLKRWLALTLELKRVKQESSDQQFEYEQNVYRLGVDVSL